MSTETSSVSPPSIKADLKELYTFCRSPCLLSERHRIKTKIMIWPRIKTADYLTPINTFLKGFLHSSMHLRLNIHRAWMNPGFSIRHFVFFPFHLQPAQTYSIAEYENVSEITTLRPPPCESPLSLRIEKLWWKDRMGASTRSIIQVRKTPKLILCIWTQRFQWRNVSSLIQWRFSHWKRYVQIKRINCLGYGAGFITLEGGQRSPRSL